MNYPYFFIAFILRDLLIASDNNLLDCPYSEKIMQLK